MKCSDYLQSVTVSLSSLIECGAFSDSSDAERLLSELRLVRMRYDGWLS